VDLFPPEPHFLFGLVVSLVNTNALFEGPGQKT